MSESGTPTYTATQTLSPDQQAIMDVGENVALLGGQTAEKLLGGSVSDTLSQPVDLSNSATEDYLYDLYTGQNDEYWAREQEQLTTQLANQGIMPGNPAYNDAMNQFADQKTDAYDDFLLSAHQTATQDILTERNQPLNELAALMSLSPVTQPSYVSTPQPGVAPTDVAGITQAAYEAEMNQYNAMMGGLFGIPTTILGGWAQSGFA